MYIKLFQFAPGVMSKNLRNINIRIVPIALQFMIKIFIVLVLVLPSFCDYPLGLDPQHDLDQFRGTNKISRYWCREYRRCSSGGGKVCGWDSLMSSLAVFEDKCTIYHANCRGMGNYHQVDMIVCDTKKNYDNEHINETFEWEHVGVTAGSNTTSSNTSISTNNNTEPTEVPPGQEFYKSSRQKTKRHRKIKHRQRVARIRRHLVSSEQQTRSQTREFREFSSLTKETEEFLPQTTDVHDFSATLTAIGHNRVKGNKGVATTSSGSQETLSQTREFDKFSSQDSDHYVRTRYTMGKNNGYFAASDNSQTKESTDVSTWEIDDYPHTRRITSLTEELLPRSDR